MGGYTWRQSATDAMMILHCAPALHLHLICLQFHFQHWGSGARPLGEFYLGHSRDLPVPERLTVRACTLFDRSPCIVGEPGRCITSIVNTRDKKCGSYHFANESSSCIAGTNEIASWALLIEQHFITSDLRGQGLISEDQQPVRVEGSSQQLSEGRAIAASM